MGHARKDGSSKKQPTIMCKRVYDAPGKDDGERVLVDRLWPRGIRKEALVHDSWLKDVAPSAELRKRFSHDPGRFDSFREAYRAELTAHPEVWRPLVEAARKTALTLLYAAHDEVHNNARVLAEFLGEQVEPGRRDRAVN